MLTSPMLPELESAEKLPPFNGGADDQIVRDIAARINVRSRRMSEWCILAFVRAIREQFPDGSFRPDDPDHQDVVAKKVGFSAGGARLHMSRYVMESLGVPA